MPNIVTSWDFEDGATQGWELGPRTVLDDTGKIQGTYSLHYARSGSRITNCNDLVASISGINLSSVTKPYLLLVLMDSGSVEWGNDPAELGIVIKDSADNILLDRTVRVAKYAMNFVRVLVFDLTSVAGYADLTIELYERGSIAPEGSGTRSHYFDMIAIIDGADYEYNTGIIVNDSEDKTLDVDVPTSDGDLSGVTVDRFAICLATPDWQYTLMTAEAITNQGSIKIDSSQSSTKHVNYTVPATAPTAFQKFTLRVKISIGAYDGWLEKIAVVFLDSGWNYKRVYLFNVYYTANGVSPRFASSVSTTTYGSTVSGSKDINVRIHGNSLQVALKVKYLVGDPSIVSVGSVTLTVYSSDKSTSYGSVTIDLTVGSEQTSTYITGLPTDTDLIFTIEWSITASARVVLLIYPLVKVS